MKKTDDSVSKSWFCVFNNPEEHGYTGTPAVIVGDIIAAWVKDNPQRTCAVTYCISVDGLKHIHAVFEDVRTMRFSKIKKIFPSMHIEATKGSKEHAEKYINKMPPYDEQGEQIVFSDRYGEIKGKQGQRRDLDILEEFINNGMTPNEIMSMSLSYRKYEKMLRDAFYNKRANETPFKRNIIVTWHYGESGSGKSYTAVKLIEEHGEEKLYFVGEYERGFDKYNGEPILFLDEFRGQLKYEQMLSLTGGYKQQIYARYANVVGLWNEIHITSIFPPEVLYQSMVQNYRTIDTYKQLSRRISIVVYHYLSENGEYCSHEMPMSEYENHEQQKKLSLKEKAHEIKLYDIQEVRINSQFEA